MNIAALSAPFDRAAVHWRAQGTPTERNGKWSAMALAYIDARDVMDRLDEVCGPDNWQTEYHETAKGRLICRLSIRINGEWITKSDGAGDTDVEGEKGAISDALKRAAVSWGVGRYLYRLSSPWVDCEVRQSNGKTYWKSWSADPWSKVKCAPPSAPQGPSPDKEHQATVAQQEPASVIKRIEAAITGKALLEVINSPGVDNANPAIAKVRVERLRVLVKGAQTVAALDAFATNFVPDWPAVAADAEARKHELQQKDAA